MHGNTEKASARLTQLAATYIAREAGRTTLITPTRTVFARDPKHATIYVTVFPDSDAEHAIGFLKRHRDMFREFIKKEGRFKILPFIEFAIDHGEKNRQRLDEISRDLES